mgnify:CR=1 FL=1
MTLLEWLFGDQKKSKKTKRPKRRRQKSPDELTNRQLDRLAWIGSMGGFVATDTHFKKVTVDKLIEHHFVRPHPIGYAVKQTVIITPKGIGYLEKRNKKLFYSG